MTPPTTLLAETAARAEDRTAPRRRANASHGRVSRIVIFVALATIATGAIVHHTTGRLGTALPPFVASWAPQAQLVPALVAAAALALAVALLPRLVAAPRVTPLAFDIIILLVALGLGLAVCAAREGTHGWWAIFDLGPHGSFEARNEYLPGLPTLSYGDGFYLDRFAELVPSQPVNVAGHPPGPLLLMDLLGVRTAQGLAALCMFACAAACAPLAHRLGRTLDGERAGRVAGALCALSPVVLLFGFTSYDAVFAACGTATALLLVTAADARARRGRAGAERVPELGAARPSAPGRRSSSGGGRACAPRWSSRPAAPRRSLAFNIILAAATGYDPIGTLRATEQVYRDSVAQQPAAVVLGLRLAGRLGRPARPAARGARAALGDRRARDRPRHRDRHRRRGGRRLHEGRDRAHLAVPRAAGVRRRGAARPPASRRCSPRWPAEALAVQLLTGTVW